MKRLLLAFLFVCVLLGLPTAAIASSFYDDFENGVGGDIVYAPWGNVSGDPTSPNGINNLVTTATEYSTSGIKSARVWASDPAAWNGFVDFGATSGALRASVWVYENYNDPGTVNPVTCMLSLYGDSGTGNPGAFTDYLQLGVVPFYPAGSTGYGWRTASDGIFNANVSREAGWTELAIEADSLADGGQVRFFIDNVLVGTSGRTSGVDLRWVRIGNNSKSYENFWYDDLRVTMVPEPTTMLLLGLSLGLIGVAGLRRK